MNIEDATPKLSPSRDNLAEQLLDLLLDDPTLLATIGEVLRKAAPLIAARRNLNALPEVNEP